MEMLVSTHPMQCSSSVASHYNLCARYRNTKNDHEIQTHAPDFERTSYSSSVLFVAFEGINLCPFKIIFGCFFPENDVQIPS